MTRVRVDGEPLLEARHFRHGVNERTVSFAPLLRNAAPAEAAGEGRDLTKREEGKR